MTPENPPPYSSSSVHLIDIGLGRESGPTLRSPAPETDFTRNDNDFPARSTAVSRKDIGCAPYIYLQRPQGVEANDPA